MGLRRLAARFVVALAVAGCGSGDGTRPADAGSPPDAATAPDATGPDAAANVDARVSTCPATHARVGQTADLATYFHGVMGTARIIDDCTIEIDDFYYDGGGIDVRFYGGLGGNYGAGFAMSGDLTSASGYHGVTLLATVPEGHTLDDLDGISVWCVDAKVSFGDGLFH